MLIVQDVFGLSFSSQKINKITKLRTVELLSYAASDAKLCTTN